MVFCFNMNSLKLSRLNTVLIVASLVLSFIIPFELFLFSYAVLGPLHYITEINWIKNKNYFITNLDTKKWYYLILVFSFIYSIPFIARLSWFQEILNEDLLIYLQTKLPLYTNGLLFLSLIIIFSIFWIKNRKAQIAAVILGIILVYFLRNIETYKLLVGALMPTLIHVYLFTVLFMIYGNIKSQQRILNLNVVLMLCVPIIILFFNVDPRIDSLAPATVKNYIDSGFYHLNQIVSQTLFNNPENQFYFNNLINFKLQIFIAFAYTYHYLNWFSKTTVIGWHRQLTKKKSLIILLVWVASMLLYAYNYQTGLFLLVFLSILHVMLEFPLNTLTLKAIVNFIKTKTN